MSSSAKADYAINQVSYGRIDLTATPAAYALIGSLSYSLNGITLPLRFTFYAIRFLGHFSCQVTWEIEIDRNGFC